ncbi:molybdate ABC transporter substrate-binding protein [Desmospora activa]|uniref:Molybdate transport system substrate-binding protein n=1 Tax=Desmospora activa DSM 45169 TaxID=1121389 RepID=A0A2T4ZAX2_9BACL|nr:molybdate ABC transporter substrate-binding protein [Desmospora activa]PTM59032.1 molybdate transport system substrate-binding protein [Desmospora activa DSM 45169]
MHRLIITMFSLFCLFIIISCSNQNSSTETTELSVLAAASLTDAFTELQAKYEAEHPHTKLLPSFASSGNLKRQIEQGASADVFLSAGTKEMESLTAQGYIDQKNQWDLLTNELVLVVPKGTNQIKSSADLNHSAVKKVAIGQPETVPAGEYGKQALESLKLWDSLQSKLIFTKDVRQTLTYVETGNVDAGIVYRSDAKTSERAVVVEPFDSDSHQPIVYPIGLLSDSNHPEQAKEWVTWLQSAEAEAIFKKYGFHVIGNSDD